MGKTKVAIVSGGYTGEYDISIHTGKNIYTHLETLDKYELYHIVIDKNSWMLKLDDVEYPIDKNDFSAELPSGKLTIDIAFLTIHGTPSEDGKLQGYLDMMGVPYCMSGVLASAITFNKKMANNHLRNTGITHIAESVLIERSSPWSVDSIIKRISLPAFVKPNEGGSSLATFKVANTEELEKAVYEALEFDDQVLVEEFIEGREFSVGVYDDDPKLVALPVTELISKNDFFDYEAKYTQGLADEITPADIPTEISEKIQQQAVEIFGLFQCAYFARIDFIWKKNTQDIYFLEVNTMPGQSDASILPQQIRESGMTLADFYDKMLSLAMKNNSKN